MIGEITALPQLILWEENVSVFQNSFLAVRLTNKASLMFLLPISLTNYILDNKNFYNNKLSAVNSFIGIFVALLSGRRALQLIVIAPILILLVVQLFLPKSLDSIKKSLKLLITVFLGIMLMFALSKILGIDSVVYSSYSTIMDAFSDTTRSLELRNTQKLLSIKFWKSSPWIGYGLTAYIPGFIRSTENYWSYEQFYYALLFQTGIIGILWRYNFIYCLSFIS